MATDPSQALQIPDNEWITFQGGELEGKRPKRLCAACRARLRQTWTRRLAVGRASDRSDRTAAEPLCFQCYREDLEREKALKAAAELDTASEQRFQCALPLDPVDCSRLATLKAERSVARLAAVATHSGSLAARRHQAQIAARHALQAIAAGLRHRESSAARRDRAMDAAIHAAELQLPEAWLPFVVCR
jgi:hypothetical protein